MIKIGHLEGGGDLPTKCQQNLSQANNHVGNAHGSFSIATEFAVSGLEKEIKDSSERD